MPTITTPAPSVKPAFPPDPPTRRRQRQASLEAFSQKVFAAFARHPKCGNCGAPTTFVPAPQLYAGPGGYYGSHTCTVCGSARDARLEEGGTQ